MRVAVLSYPMLFQSSGGLQMKVGRTVDALNQRGIEARLIDPVREKLKDYDLLHLFAPYNGNYRIVEQAKGDGLPVVISTILNAPFSKWDGLRGRVISRLVGRLSGWLFTTSYQQTLTALVLADHLIALGEVERRILTEGYGIGEDKISIVPNGVGEEFFVASPALFESKYAVPKPMVLHTGIIGDVKNQLGLVRALRHDPVHIALIGYLNQSNADYLQECQRLGGDRVHYLGEFPHGEMLASAYASADVVAIPSRHEGMPNSILEALASDKPVVMTCNHSMDLHLPSDVAVEVDPDDDNGIRKAVLGLLEQPPIPNRCRAQVDSLSWPAVAERLENIYRKLC